MSIIRGGKIEEIATLLSTKELHFSDKDQRSDDFIEEECRRSFQKGQERGEQIGYEKALGETTVLFSLLQTVATKLLEHKEKLLEHLKPEVVEFSITVCEQVIRNELSRPEALTTLIYSLLEFSQSKHYGQSIQIVLSSDDLSLIETRLDQIQDEIGPIKGIVFQFDPLMKRGDCRIETKTGLLNYEISRELKLLQSKVLKREWENF
jgi:flagellar biosynthesis/type III secretory pathway protein FliH